jgi:hypothetical protein
MAAFGSWLQQEAATSSTLAGYASPPGLAPVQIESAFAAFDYDNDGRVKKKVKMHNSQIVWYLAPQAGASHLRLLFLVLQEWINASLSLTAASFLCANTSGQLYAITYQGKECHAGKKVSCMYAAADGNSSCCTVCWNCICP